MWYHKVQTGKEGCNGKRVFMCSKRAMTADGVRGKGTVSFWKPIVVHDILSYVSTVTGIGLGTVVFARWTNTDQGRILMTHRGAFVSGDGNRSNVEVIHLGSIGKSVASSTAGFEMSLIRRRC